MTRYESKIINLEVSSVINWARRIVRVDSEYRNYARYSDEKYIICNSISRFQVRYLYISCVVAMLFR